MANSDARSDLPNLPAWRGWLLIFGSAVSFGALVTWLLPSLWRPAWFTDLLAFDLVQLGNCAVVVTACAGRRSPSVSRAERIALDLVVGLFAVTLVDSILEPFGLAFIPAPYKGGLTVTALAAGAILLLARDVRRQLQEAKPRRRDIAMGE